MTFQEIKGVTYRSSHSNQRVIRKLKGIVPQPSQQEAKEQKIFSQKDLGSWLFV